MLIVSKTSADIGIEHLDEGAGPDRFVISASGMSYTVVASEACLTSGDLETVARAPRPARDTDGVTVQIVNLHDSYAAKAGGFRYGQSRVTMLVVLDAPAKGLKIGSYHDFASFGSAPAISPINDVNPEFVGAFADVTEEFVAAASPEQLQARIDMGRVYQRMCVDIDPLRSWLAELPPGIVFCGMEAPAIEALGRRERIGLVLEAGFGSLDDFRAARIVDYPQTREWAEVLAAGDGHDLPRPDGEALHHHRLHTDEAVQDDCYREMSEAAVIAFKEVPCPEVSQELVAAPLPQTFGV
jgi:hypothetical protein|nr:hypothetical protein [Neorhizobium tomejilense]